MEKTWERKHQRVVLRKRDETPARHHHTRNAKFTDRTHSSAIGRDSKRIPCPWLRASRRTYRQPRGYFTLNAQQTLRQRILMDNLSPIVQRIPQLSRARTLEIEELSGGITNKNYKITADGECFVLRLGGNETQYLGIDRKNEYECSVLASQVGVAPEPTAFLEPEGYIVARFISGKGIPLEEIGKEENI